MFYESADWRKIICQEFARGLRPEGGKAREDSDMLLARVSRFGLAGKEAGKWDHVGSLSIPFRPSFSCDLWTVL